jgi:hypothetical protein
MLGHMFTSKQDPHDDVNVIHEVPGSSTGSRLVAFGHQLAGDRARDD